MTRTFIKDEFVEELVDLLWRQTIKIGDENNNMDYDTFTRYLAETFQEFYFNTVGQKTYGFLKDGNEDYLH